MFLIKSYKWAFVWGSLLGIVLLFSGCVTPPEYDKSARQITVVHINDVYRLDRLAKVRALRKELGGSQGNVLFLHGGDMLFPSLMSKYFDGMQMIDVLNTMDGVDNHFDPYMFSVFGNHEFDRDALDQVGILESAVKQSEFTWLNSNITFSNSNELASSSVINNHKILTINGIKVGLFGLTIDTKKPDYASFDTRYKAIAKQQTELLRGLGAELVIALTHLTVADDRAILELGAQGPDVIYGGHEHYRFVERVNGRPIIKADADALSASVSTITVSDVGAVEIAAKFEFLDDRSASDGFVDKHIQQWNQKLDALTCGNQAGDNCVNEKLAVLSTDLIGVEQKIRRFETNLGNWLADIALNDFRAQGAQVAFLNSGGIRLNENLAAGTSFTVGHLKELLPYKTDLVLIELTGAELQQVVNQSVREWDANGWWLQVSGLAFQHDVANQQALELSLVNESGVIKVKPDDRIIAVTNGYLLDSNGGQDGYTFLNKSHVLAGNGSGLDLAQLVKAALGVTPLIIPAVEGRICNRDYQTPCILTVDSGKPY